MKTVRNVQTEFYLCSVKVAKYTFLSYRATCIVRGNEKRATALTSAISIVIVSGTRRKLVSLANPFCFPRARSLGTTTTKQSVVGKPLFVSSCAAKWNGTCFSVRNPTKHHFTEPAVLTLRGRGEVCSWTFRDANKKQTKNSDRAENR